MKLYLFGLSLLTVSGLLLSSHIAFSQSDTVGIRRIDPRKPSVFIGFDSRVRSFEQCSRKEQSSFRLRLYNNTSTPINVDARYGADEATVAVKGANGEIFKGLPKGAKVGLCYQPDSVISYESKQEGGSVFTEIPVERKIPPMEFLCSCKSQMSADRAFNSRGLWIPSGSYVLFDVPQKYLEDQLKIYTLFNYEWEFEKDGLNLNEPHHQVFFYYSDIP